MKTILRIAKFELSTLFYSPIAWLILIIFIVQSAYTYSSVLDGIAYGIQMGLFDATNGVTYELFSSRYGLLGKVMSTVYFYIPLLTMGLISRELASGSIKLLMSSPITATQLILGKYVAIIGYVLLMTLVLLGFAFISHFAVESVDWELMLSCLLSFFLLTAVYAAIGLFLSSLTSYQVIAAIGTLTVLGALNFVGTLGQGIPVLEDITYWLSISGRALEMIIGLISTQDILYFIIIATMFLGFAILKISLSRQVLSVWGKVQRYAMLLGAAGVGAYLSSMPVLVGYIDASRTDYNTLTPAGKNIIEQIDDDITMTTYVNIFDSNATWAFPEYRNEDKKAFRTYTRHIPQLKFEYVYYYQELPEAQYLKELYPEVTDLDELADKYLESQDLDRNDLSSSNSPLLNPEQIKERVDLSNYGYQFTREFSYKGKKSYANMLDDSPPYPLEQEMMATLKHLLSKPSKITYLVGNGERDAQNSRSKGYFNILGNKQFRNNLTNKGFDVEFVNLTHTDIAQDTDILFIAAPTRSYSETEQAKIKAYFDNGGSALILAEPEHRQTVSPIVNYLGVAYVDGVVTQDNDNYELNDVLAKPTSGIAQLSETLLEQTIGWFPDKAMGLRVNADKGYRATPILEANNTSIGLTLTKPHADKEQRILLVGDADWIGNLGMQPHPFWMNVPVYLKAFNWLSNNEYPIIVDRPKVHDMNLTINKEQIKTLKIMLVGIVPVIIFIFANIVLIRRRRN